MAGVTRQMISSRYGVKEEDVKCLKCGEYRTQDDGSYFCNYWLLEDNTPDGYCSFWYPEGEENKE